MVKLKEIHNQGDRINPYESRNGEKGNMKQQTTTKGNLSKNMPCEGWIGHLGTSYVQKQILPICCTQRRSDLDGGKRPLYTSKPK